MKLKIKKDDTVMVIAGNEKGAVGRVLDVYPEKQRILVEQVNIRSKHEKPGRNPQNQQGGINKVECPIHYSNVMLMDGSKKPTRVGIQINDKGVKTRIAKTNGKAI
jgi:large subunit ribosomal protein L24